MTQATRREPLFANLVYDEEGQPVATTLVGTEPHYVIMDGDFKRHVPSEDVDRQVIEWLSSQIFANKDLVSEGVMQMIGKDDLFTKAMVDSSIKNMDKLIEQGLPPDAKMMLGMMGFKVIVNFHGELVKLDMPASGLEGFMGGGDS